MRNTVTWAKSVQSGKRLRQVRAGRLPLDLQSPRGQFFPSTLHLVSDERFHRGVDVGMFLYGLPAYKRRSFIFGRDDTADHENQRLQDRRKERRRSSYAVERIEHARVDRGPERREEVLERMIRRSCYNLRRLSEVHVYCREASTLTGDGIVDKITRTVGYPCAGDPEQPVARNCRNSVYACDGLDGEGEGFGGGCAASSSLSESDSSSSSLPASASSVHEFG